MVEKQLEKAILDNANDGRLSCVAAFKLSGEFDIPPEKTGELLNRLKIRIVHCQLGLFGYEDSKKIIQVMDNVPEEIKKAISSELIDGRLHCKKAWEIADRFQVSKLTIANACETLNIKIKKCQLGAF